MLFIPANGAKITTGIVLVVFDREEKNGILFANFSLGKHGEPLHVDYVDNARDAKQYTLMEADYIIQYQEDNEESQDLQLAKLN